MIERAGNAQEKKQKLDLTALKFSSIFRKYDIRGNFPNEINQDVAISIGWSFGQYLLRQGGVKEVVLGHDSRRASYEVVPSFAMGLSALGFKVICQKECPTPAISKLVESGVYKAGVSVTASHNEIEQTGFKLYCNGKQVYDKQMDEIVSHLGDPDYIKQTFSADLAQGQNKSVMNINIGGVEDYFYKIGSEFNFAGKNTKIVVSSFSQRVEEHLTNLFECTNLVGYRFYSCNRDRFVQNCDPSEVENFLPIVKFISARQTKDCIGIMFDGDFDRLVVVDELGRVVDPSTLAAVFVKHLSKTNKGPVVVDVCTNSQVQLVAKESGLDCSVSKTGAAFVLEKAKSLGAMFASESSGHYTFLDRGHSVDDGIYAALRLVQMLSEVEQPLWKLVDEIPAIFTTGVLRLDCGQDMAHAALEKVESNFGSRAESVVCKLDGIMVSFGDGSSLLVRASNTQDKLVVMVQAKLEDTLKVLVEDLRQVLLSVFEKESSCEL